MRAHGGVVRAAHFERAGTVLLGLGALLAVAGAAYLAFTPVYGGVVTVTDSAGFATGPTPLPSQTLAEVQGPGVYLILLLPVTLAAFPLLVREPRARVFASWLSTVLLGGFCVLGAWTIGLYYVPAVPALLLGAVLLTSSPGRRAPGS